MEDQEIMEQFMENKQGYVIDNMNAVAGCGGIGVGEVMGSSEEILGVKYDEQLHEKTDFGDDDELKYVKEVQQSEKQHSMENVGDGRNTNELAEKEEEVDKYKVGIEEENMHNQNDFENITHGIANDNTNGHGDHNVYDQLKNVAEASSPTVASAGTEYVAYSSAENYQEQYEMEKDEDSSSLTTNTTNGSSLSENLMQAIACVEEKASPFIAATVEDQTTDMNIDKSADFETMSSQLNPEAKEFVPAFESSLLSPNSPSGLAMAPLEDDELEKAYFGHIPSIVPRHLMTEDDFVAQSPRKGRGDNMDTISVPAVQEFEEEADQRPHELEADEQTKIVEENNLKTDKVHQHNLSDHSISPYDQLTCDSDFIENKAPDVMDHGPETYVDLDVDININEQPCMGLSEKENDLMKQSIYVTNDEAIENVLNSVQPIPTEIDSANNSFTDEVSGVVPIVDKELLQVEEKEHISKSPSTEEIQLNMHSSNKDVSEVSFDIKDASMMYDSFYADQAVQHGTNNCTEAIDNTPTFDIPKILEDSNKRDEIPNLERITSEYQQPNLIDSNYTQNELYGTHSSVDEKQLLEQTKELQTNMHKSSIEHLMSGMQIDDDGIHPQVNEEEAAHVAINNDESKNSSSSERFVNKTEHIMVVDENADTENYFIHHSPTQGEDTGVENLESQRTSKANEYDLVQIEEPLTDNKIASQLTVTICANEAETTKTDHLSEDVTPNVDVVSSIIGLPSQLEEALNPHTISDFMHIPEQFEILHQKEIVETEDSGVEQVLGGYSIKEKENTTATKLASGEELSYGEKDVGQQDLYKTIIASIAEEIRAEPSSETIIDDTAAEKVLEKVPISVCSTSTVKAALPLEACSINTVKKTGAKNTSCALKAKATPSLPSSSKKLTTTEVTKKPIGVVTKPKLAAVKPSTISLSSDKKPNKPTSVGALNARKPVANATAAPKIPLKANVSSRSTQISTSTSTTKTTTSRPITASRTLTSAHTTVRKPAAFVPNSTAKTRPASASAVPAKPNTLGAAGTSTSKPKVASPRATLTSQMRKPAPSSTTAKSPVKSTVPNNLTKTASSSLGTRPKPVSSTTSSVGSATTKPIAARVAPKVASSSTTTARRLTVGGLTGGTAITNTATKATTSRKSSPIKPTSGKTQTKPNKPITSSNTKAVNKSTPPKLTENKLNEQSVMNGGINSDEPNDLNSINRSSQDASVTGEHQQTFVDQEDLNIPHTIGSNLATSEDFKRGVIDPFQEDLIGAYDH